jgi:hypothetical protein
LYETLGKRSHAANVYLEYVAESQRLITLDSSGFLAERGDLAQAYRFLANHYNNLNDLDQACLYCNKCLEFEEVIDFMVDTQNESSVQAASGAIATIMLIAHRPCVAFILCIHHYFKSQQITKGKSGNYFCSLLINCNRSVAFSSRMVILTSEWKQCSGIWNISFIRGQEHF